MGDNTQKGLGKGLDALIPTGTSNENTAVSEVPVALVDVNPYQPRTVFDEEGLGELANSIKKHGILQPLVVSPKQDHYELIAGERRLRAAKIAGLANVPVIVREADEHQKLEIALIENVHRKDLNPIDEALSYRKLIEEFSYTQEQAAEAVGKSRAAVANKIRLLSLPLDIKKAIKEGKITEGHAKALLSIDDTAKQMAVFEQILAGDLNVRAVEEKARRHSQSKDPKPHDVNSETDLMIKQLSSDLKTYLGAKVNIKHGQKGGKIEIDYYSNEELARIYQKIKGME